MFSSSLLTAETPLPSQAKAGSAKTSPEQLTDGSRAVKEEAGAFAKEFQAVVSDEKKVTANQPPAAGSQGESGHAAQLTTDTETEEQHLVAQTASSEEQATDATEQVGKVLSNSLIENSKGDIESSPGQTAEAQGAQIPAHQKDGGQPDLDPEKKQQIMSDGEALLSRLSDANKQLVAGAGNVSEGKKLPPGHLGSEEATADGQGAGITQEELAKVFAAKGAKSIHLQSGDLQQSAKAAAAKEQQVSAGLASAAPASTDLASTDLASADLLSSGQTGGKGQAGSVFTPAAVASGAVANSSSIQSLITESNHALASAGNPALSAAELTVAPGQLATNTGTLEAQLSSTAGITAGTAAMATALEQGLTDGSSEAKPAELTHSLSGLSTQQGQASAAQARAEAALAQSPLQLNKEQAGEQLSERMQMMMSKNLKHVDIRLDPPELGKMQIKLSLNQDQASVQFTVGNQQTRDLVEQAMPRLRELLNQQGLQLAQSSIQQDSSRQQFAGQSNQQQQGQQTGQGGQHNSGTAQGREAGLGTTEPVDIYVSQPTDRVDYYA